MMGDDFATVWWANDAVALVDQRRLPAESVTLMLTEVGQVAAAIRTLQVRGAPAIGCAAAFGMALLCRAPVTDTSAALAWLTDAKRELDAQRPTAVNLAWATARVLSACEAAAAHPAASVAAIAAAALACAQTIAAEDRAMCDAIGVAGASLIPAGGRVLTHCNAGSLATAGRGTALAPIYAAHAAGRPIHVWVDETRPLLQGARLTAWELQRASVPLTLITDSMAAAVMQRGQVDCVIVGADRVVANGDIANKIGTYGVAVLARHHGIPFYVAAPSSTVDLALPDGAAIPIETRDAAEVTELGGSRTAPPDVTVFNPAFDVTPHSLISAIITERGVIYPPFGPGLAALRDPEVVKPAVTEQGE